MHQDYLYLSSENMTLDCYCYSRYISAFFAISTQLYGSVIIKKKSNNRKITSSKKMGFRGDKEKEEVEVVVVFGQYSEENITCTYVLGSVW